MLLRAAWIFHWHSDPNKPKRSRPKPSICRPANAEEGIGLLALCDGEKSEPPPKRSRLEETATVDDSARALDALLEQRFHANLQEDVRGSLRVDL